MLFSNISLFIIIFLLLVCIVLLFVLSRSKRDSHELHQDLNKTITDFNQLVDKHERLSLLKNQADISLAQVQSTLEQTQLRLEERGQENYSLERELSNLSQKNTALSQEIATLRTQLIEKENSFSEQQKNFVETKQQLSIEFQNLANRILEEKSQIFSQHNQASLQNLLKPFREQIEGFQKRVNEIHSEALKGNASIETEIKKVLELGLSMSEQANNLTSALRGEKKTLGTWGEIQLEQALQLAGLLEGEHYQSQSHFRDQQGKHNYPDFVVNLPDNKHLVIDSKMSLIAYESAVNSKDESEKRQFLHEHIKALKNHVDDLSKKDYSNLIGIHSPNFVLMFVAVEAAYIEAMKADSALFNYAYQKNIILVSHTTLMPILRTVANLWRIERGNIEAKEISEKAGDIYNQVCLLAERLNKLGNGLLTVSSYYNNTVTALAGNQGLIGKVERFKDLSAKANKTMPAVELLHQDVNTEKLLAIRGEN